MNGKIILLVEDDPDDEVLTIRALTRNNISNEIIVVRDGAEAINYLSDDTRVRPQVVLLDLGLPKIDGLEVLRKIRSDKRTMHLPVIVFTSSREEQDKIRSYNLGANSYIRKPVEMPSLVEAVRELGLCWFLHCQQTSREVPTIF